MADKKNEIRGKKPQNEKRLNAEALLDSMPGMAFRCLDDPDWTMLYVSKGCLELTGFQAEALIGNREFSYEYLIHPDDRKRVREEIHAAFPQGQRYELTYRIRTRDRETRWVLERGYKSEETYRGKRIIEGVIVDITARKKAEERLMAEENLLRSVLRSIPGGVGMVRNRTLIWVNDTFCRMFERPEEELIGKNTSVIYPSTQEYERVGKELYPALERDGFAGLEAELMTGSGRLLHAIFTITYVNPQKPEEGAVFVVTDVSAMKKVERELRESEMKYSQLVRSNPDSIMVVSGGKYTYVNPAAYKTLGYRNAEEVTGLEADVTVHPDFRIFIKERRKKALQGETNPPAVIRMLKKNGETLWAETYSMPMVYQGEKAVMVIAKDVTEKLIAEEKLRQSETLLKKIYDTTPVGLGIMQNRVLKSVNRGFMQITGYSEEELRGRSARMLYHSEEEFNRVGKLIEKFRTDRSFQPIETVIRHKTGREVPVYFQTLPVLATDLMGEMVFSVIDLTPIREAETRMQQSQTTFQTFMDNLPASAYIKDDRLRHVFVNRYFLDMAGLKEEEIIGKKGREVFPPSTAEAMERMDQIVLDKGKTVTREYPIVLPGGETSWQYDIKFPLTGVDGSRMVGGISVDITRRREMEEKLRESEERFRALVSSMEDIIFTLDTRGRHTGLYGRWVEKYAASPADFLGKSAVDIFGKNAGRIHMESNKQALKGEFVVYEWEAGEEEGKSYFQTSLSPIRDSEGKVAGLVGIGRDITELKTAEKRLRESEKNFRAFMDYIPAYIVLKDNQLNYVYANNRLTHDLGITEKDLKNLKEKELFEPHLAETILRLEKKVLKQKTVQEIPEIRIRWKNRERWLRGVAFPVVMSGNEEYVGEFYVDVTAHKQMEETLQQALQTSDDIVRTIPSGLLIFGFAGKGQLILEGGNPQAARITGMNMKSFLGKTFEQIWPDPAGAILKQAFLKVIEKGNAYHNDDFRYEGKYLNGTFRIRAFRMPGQRVGVAFEDITEFKKAEQRLRESEKKYRQLVEKAGIGILIDNREGRITYANRLLAGMFGYSMKEIGQMKNTDLFSQEDVPRIRKYHRKRMAGGRVPSRYELRGVKKDGKSLWIEIKVTLLKVGNEITGTRNYLWDITERKKREDELRESYRQIRKLSRHLDSVREEERKEIAREIHDELGQILTALKIDISWLEKHTKPEEPGYRAKAQSMKEMADMAIKSVQRISAELRPSLIDDLGLKDALEWIMNDMEDRSGIHMQLDFAPEGTSIDPKQAITVFRLVQEGLTNVVRHAGADRARVALTVRDGMLKLIISDNGKGIEKKKIRSTESLGIMGMRERAMLYDGEVQFTAEKGKGTAVNIQMKFIKQEQA